MRILSKMLLILIKWIALTVTISKATVLIKTKKDKLLKSDMNYYMNIQNIWKQKEMNKIKLLRKKQ